MQPPDIKELETQLSLEDLETINVIGKGSGGVVQLVRHKWLGTFFALKVTNWTPLFLSLLVDKACLF